MSVRMTFLRATALAGFATASLIAPMNKLKAASYTTGAVSGTSAGTLAVGMTVVPSCGAQVNTAVSFGTTVTSAIAATALAAPTPGQIVVTCTSGTQFFISLGAGSNGGTALAGGRIMSNGTTSINYTLTLGTGNTPAGTAANSATNWGSIDGTDDVYFTSTGAATAINVAGTLIAGTTATAGAYTDSIPVTINY